MLIAVLICVVFADLVTATTLVLLLLLVGKLTDDVALDSGRHATGPGATGSPPPAQRP